MHIVLINPNRIKPVIAPIGLEMLAEVLTSHHIHTTIIDLTFELNPEIKLKEILTQIDAVLIGISIRNTDDCFFAGQGSFLNEYLTLMKIIRCLTKIPIVIGGVGFSTSSKALLSLLKAEYGIHGDGEEALVKLVSYLKYNEPSLNEIAGLLYWNEDQIIENPMQNINLNNLSLIPPRNRNILNNIRYFKEGGQIGFETKRGCDQNCIYCADPVSKGRNVRVRSPELIVMEIQQLVKIGITVFHTCDCEFNIPIEHALEICHEIIKSGLNSHINWYAYCHPSSDYFTEELAQLMNHAGCRGINFGVDGADNNQLLRLGRHYTFQELKKTAELTKKVGMLCMYDLLLGGPGETIDSLKNTITNIKSLPVDKIGISFGVRIYEDTPLAQLVRNQGNLSENPNIHGRIQENPGFIYPIYYIDHKLGKIDEIERKIAEYIGDDKRFLFAFSKDQTKNYNYNENKVLTDAIQAGARGAYWKILLDIEKKEKT